MTTLIQSALALVINAIPIGGIVLDRWTPATALTLYWFENLIGSILMAARIALHRRLTRKRGHTRAQLGVTVTTGNGGRRQMTKPGTFLGEFLLGSLVFTVAHGVFLAAALVLITKTAPDRSQLAQGVTWISVALLVSFFADLIDLRNWSFAALKQRAGAMLGRVVLIHLAMIGGTFFAAVSNHPAAFFGVFAILKTFSDVAALLPVRLDAPDEAPRWFLRLTKLFGGGKHWKTGQDAATWWRETTRAEKRDASVDEEIEPPDAGR